MATAFMVGGTLGMGRLLSLAGARAGGRRRAPAGAGTIAEKHGARQEQTWAGLSCARPTLQPASECIRIMRMSWDDDRLSPVKPAVAITVGEPLAALSIGELEARIAALTAEIERVRDEMRAKQAHEAAAAALFKKS
jgi:uncharacterized small protein (DUF1192 family)